MKRSVRPLCKTKSNIKLDKIVNNNHFKAMDIEQREIIIEKDLFLKKSARILGKSCGNMHLFCLEMLPQPMLVGESCSLPG